MCHLSVGLEDEQAEREGNRFCSRVSPVQKNKYGPVWHIYFLPFLYASLICRHLSWKLLMRELWMQLPFNTIKSQGRAGKRDPISVDKMYSSQPSSTSLSAKRTHAIGPEVSDHEKCQKIESSLPRRFSKR